MVFSVSPISSRDRQGIMDIFNYYAENSFAAYPEKKLPYEAFDVFVQVSRGYPTGTVTDEDGKIIGFGMLRVHNAMPVFSQTAEATYFIHYEHTGKGIGSLLLSYLERKARQMGIKNILASISSLNPGSIAFHAKNGFEECGRFRNVGKKNGRDFDTVWMQKFLS